MKSKFWQSIVIAAATLGTAATASAQTPTLENARRLKGVIDDAKQRVDDLIARGRGSGGNEDDLLALPPLLEASSSLFNAGVWADALIQNLTPPGFPNFSLAGFQFARACTFTGLARSQVARSRLGAAVPPIGFLTTTDPQYGLVINELSALRSAPPFGVGCP